MHYAFLSVYLLLIIACNNQSPKLAQIPKPYEHLPDTSTKPTYSVLSLGQMDSLTHAQGKPISNSLWKLINVDGFIEIPNTLGVISGNLDQDAEEELVVWYRRDVAGTAICFDKKDNTWNIIGVEELSFWRGDSAPYIDPSLKALVTYGYGSGSGYGATYLYFHLYKDSLFHVMTVVESEYVAMNSTSSYRTVEGKYKIIDQSSVLVNYTYKITCGDEGKHYKETLFKQRFTIPHYWNQEMKCFLPELPKGFTEPADIRNGFTEDEFDSYFRPVLDSISKTGPIWKRHALGNHADE